MIHNRSVPTDTLLPHLVYEDVAAALAWLSSAFGFTEYYRYGPPDNPLGAQARRGDVWIMLERARPDRPTPAQIGHNTQFLSIFVADVRAHHATARAAGAVVTEELNETIYGELQYVARDPDGHHWLFSQHLRDLSPTAWGAHLAPPSKDPEP